MDSLKSIAVPVTRKRTTSVAAKPRSSGRPLPPVDSHVGGMVGAPRRSAPALAAAVAHRYQVGQRLQMLGGGRSWARAGGVCRITALMPHENGPLLYRVRSEMESFERVVAEDDLTTLD
ncbi:hypothetical protein [Devosia sp.]|uniref:hypothetical protein n=1 Tax=Devosia sp. TaxID=1871048 RepID=UPI002EFFDF10